MSDLLREFLKAWLEWAEGDVSDSTPFDATAGLCWNARLYILALPVRPIGVSPYDLSDELEFIFRDGGLCRSYPFGKNAYKDAEALQAMHKDPNRLAWVRKQLEVA